MKILHTSDWHLGRQFYNQSLLSDQQFVLDQIVTIAKKRAVDVVVVAGDLYDRSVPPGAAVDLLDQTLTKFCCDLHLPVIVISGNHDGPERLSFGARQMAGSGLHVIGKLRDEPTEIIINGRDGDRMAFYPIPYSDPATVRYQYNVEVSTHQQAMQHLISMITDACHAEYPAVAMAHCFLVGGESSESERPLSLGGLEFVDPQLFSSFSYTALGHLHGHQSRMENRIVYSGSPLKYSFSEQHQNKSVCLVDIAYGEIIGFERIPLNSIRDMRTIEGSLEEILKTGRGDINNEDYLQIRLSDSHAILDVMAKLREVYPNVLHLERPGLIQQRDYNGYQREQLARGELAMFSDFFAQTSGQVLSKEQEDVIRFELEQLHTKGL